MTELLIPSSINVYIGISAAGLFWTLNEFVSGIVAVLFVKKAKVASESVNKNLADAKTALVHSITIPLNVAVIYLTNLITFLVNSFSWVLICFLLLTLSFALTNFQQEIIVIIDYAYESLYPTIILPVKSAFNLFVIILEIAVAILNFISQYTQSVLLDTTKHLAACPGYLSSFYLIFAELATTIYTFVLGVINWVSALRNFTSTTGQTTPLDMRTPVAPLRIITYDAILRFQCACPADRGFLDLVTTGLINPTTTVLDDLVHFGVNSVLSIPQAILESVIAAASSGKYYPPATDNIINNFVGLTVAAQTVLNQIFRNLVNYVQQLIQLAEGTKFYTWQAIPIFSIPGTAIVVLLEFLRLILRCVVNVPGFLLGSKLVGQSVTLAQPYTLVDTTRIYAAAVNVSSAVWIQNFGGIYPPILNTTGFFLYAATNMPLGYAQFASITVSRLAFGRDVTNGTRFVTPFTGVCALPTNTVFGKGFTNWWTGIYDVMGEYDVYVTASYGVLGTAFQGIWAPYYPPLGTSGGLLIAALANMVSTRIKKTVYIINALVTLSPPNYQCFAGLERPTRIAVDNLMLSLPDFLEFFLNIPMAQAARNAHMNCGDHNNPNFILSGSLKMPYYAAKMCNVLYVDQTLISCPFPNNSSCPQYTLPYMDINSHLLCAGDIFALDFLEQSIQEERLVMQYAEKSFVTLLACIIAPGNTVTCPLNPSQTLQQAITTMGLLGCHQFNQVVKGGNIIGDFLGIGFFYAYKYFAGSNVGPLQVATYPQVLHQESFNGIDMPGPDLSTFFTERQSMNL